MPDPAMLADGALILNGIGAVAAAVAAVAAWQATIATRRAAEGQLLSALLGEYASGEMRDALRVLVDWHSRYGPDGGARWIELWQSGDPEGTRIDSARRIVTHFWSRIARLQRAKALSRASMRVLCDVSGLGVLFQVNETLEKALNPNYPAWVFALLREDCRSFGIQHQLVHRPRES